MRKLAISLVITLLGTNTHAASDHLIFQHIFDDWTNAFNHKELDKTCNLFSKTVKATYQGVPEKNYRAICDGFKKVFNEKDTRYHYRFKLRHVYRENNLAAVRITWYLDISKDGKLVSHIQDEGIDIFKHHKGEWKIVNYIGYPVK